MSKTISANLYPKYEGAGNDFLLVDDRTFSFSTQNIPELCANRDVDGLLLLQTDLSADFRMRIFNRDGSEAASCGNGLRCLLRFLLDLGYPRQTYRIAVGEKIVEGSYVGDQIAIDMGIPQHLRLHLPIDQTTVHAVDTGVPHVVVFVKNLKGVNVAEQGRFLRHHPLFQPQGTNVNFAEMQPDGSIAVRTFERGVEGETLACGTGAVAVAVIASALYQLPSPIRIVFQGGTLEIKLLDSSRIQMIGPARQEN